MLILIAGITGMCGQPCARVALAQGHQVRGLGRSPDKLDKSISSQLEGFVTLRDYFDTEALDKAVQGVDAVIASLPITADVVIGGQLALLLAAEKAGVKIFHAASWNLDWTKLPIGAHETYDQYIMFKRSAELCSSINPIYGFTGGILEYVFLVDPERGAIDKKAQTLTYFGNGTETQPMVTVTNLAEYAIAAITEPDAEKGGIYHVESFHASWKDLARDYGEVRGIQLKEKPMGDIEVAKQWLQKARQDTKLKDHVQYIGLAYVVVTLDGSTLFEATDSKRWANKVKQTSFKEWLKQNPEA